MNDLKNSSKASLLRKFNAGEGYEIFFNPTYEIALEQCFTKLPANKKIMTLSNGPQARKFQEACEKARLLQLKYIASDGKVIDLESVKYVIGIHDQEISHIFYAYNENLDPEKKWIQGISEIAKEFQKDIVVDCSNINAEQGIDIISCNISILIGEYKEDNELRFFTISK